MYYLNLNLKEVLYFIHLSTGNYIISIYIHKVYFRQRHRLHIPHAVMHNPSYSLLRTRNSVHTASTPRGVSLTKKNQ